MSYQQQFIELGLISNYHINTNYINIACPLHEEVNGKALCLNFNNSRYQCKGKCQESGKMSALLAKLGIRVFDEGMTFENCEYNKVERFLTEYNFDKIVNRFNYNLSHDDKINYLEKRHLTSSIYNQNYIYLNKENRRIYIPVLMNGKCYGYIHRSIYNLDTIFSTICKELNLPDVKESHQQIMFQIEMTETKAYNKYRESNKKYNWLNRYLNSKNLIKEKLVYEPLSNDRIESDKIIIVEGSLDANYVNQYGYKAIAVIGSGINKEHIKYIKDKYRNYEIITGFDNDIAGEKFHEQFIKLSGDFHKNINFNLIRDKLIKDAGDCTSEEYKYLIKKASYK